MPSPRLRARHRHTVTWPLTVEEELARGIDLTVYTSKLARMLASFAQRRAEDHTEVDDWDRQRALDQLRSARGMEEEWRIAFPGGGPTR